MKQAKVTLEQWQAFKTVVDEGSFSKAAEALNKSQSTISYAISKLEEQLPLPVLTIEGRKAVMTEEGKVLYRKASQLLEMALNVEQTAQCLAEGWETRITINKDSIVPLLPVMQAIKKFADATPQTRVTLLESTLSGTVESLLEKKADIVLTGQLPPGFLPNQVTEVSMLPVAHANHPLCRLKRPATPQDLQQHRQIVVRDSGTKRNLDSGWLEAEQRLTVSHFKQTLEALTLGLGFAFVPDHLVADAIAGGILKVFELEDYSVRKIPVYLLKSMTDNEGPARREMTNLLKNAFCT